MDPKVNYIAVGAFMLVLLIATVIFSLWLAFGYGENTQQDYLIYIKESVTGLSQDSAVKFNGVNVGVVKNIALDPKDPSVVVIDIGVDKGTPVTVDTRATLASQGLTGLSYVNLSGGDSHSALLKAKPGQSLPVIPSSPSFLFRVDSTFNQLSVSLTNISQATQQLLSPENQKHWHNILANLDQVSSALANQHQNLQDSLNQLPMLLKDLQKTSQNAGLTLDAVNNQTLPALNETLFMMQNVLPNITDFSQELTRNPSVILRGQTAPTPGPGEQ